jgi:hypothetical protein
MYSTIRHVDALHDPGVAQKSPRPLRVSLHQRESNFVQMEKRWTKIPVAASSRPIFDDIQI